MSESMEIKTANDNLVLWRHEGSLLYRVPFVRYDEDDVVDIILSCLNPAPRSNCFRPTRTSSSLDFLSALILVNSLFKQFFRHFSTSAGSLSMNEDRMFKPELHLRKQLFSLPIWR